MDVFIFPQSIGLKGILLNGNEWQKKKYLPKLATGLALSISSVIFCGSGLPMLLVT